MSKALDRAKDLAKKTNATVMVVNETTDEVFVVMTIDQYERLTTNDQQPTINNQRSTTNDQRPTTGQSSVVSRESSVVSRQSSVNNDESSVVSRQSSVNLASLTEQDLLARMGEQVREWRSAQVNREQLVLAEMPAEVKVSGTGDKEQGKYNLSGKVDFKVDNLEDEERFFLDDLG